ncbi:histidine-type phosphatase [Pantoea sp.]|uniref:histidine-type phosphatase n=1 Tax=Pantoea sp. TaxID=69393 RepID=UPI00289CF6E4|nr:histidine-type phosphatase [Pantoea sp.]
MKHLLFALTALLALWLNGSFAADATDDWQLEKVVEISRHGVRPPTPGQRKEIEAATQRAWPRWSTADGELTGHGYSAVVNKGRAEGDRYRQLGLFPAGCPDAQAVYVRASPLQRTRATAQALMDGAFPGCGVKIHHVDGDVDPLFQTEKLAMAQLDPQRELAAVTRAAGDLAGLQRRLQPAVQLLKASVCRPAADCPFFNRPWQLKQTRSGNVYVQGLSAMASMAETLRLAWNENLPLSEVAFGQITRSAQISAMLPLITANYDLSNDVPYIARRRGSMLLNAVVENLRQGVDANDPTLPDTRWLLLVAHDTNIAMLRTLIGFSWQLPGYARGNIPPGGSLVFERWRERRSGKRFIRLYFQAQDLDAIRRLQPVDAQHPLLHQPWLQKNCRIASVGVLCPYESTLSRMRSHIDIQAQQPINYPFP